MATIADLTPSVVRLLGNRSDVAALVPENMGDAILELSDNYPFEELRLTGPTVQLTPGQNAYDPSVFQAAPVSGNTYKINKVLSWFLYYGVPTNLLSTGGGVGVSNPGYNLRFKDMSDIEVLANTISIPQFWSWLGPDLYVAAVPTKAYYSYIRYQWLHPFTTPTALSTDNIYLPSTWYDIIEYSTAERIALNLRMQDVADRMHVKLFGDPKRPGELGLIAARTSQTRKNQSRTTRSMQIVRSRY